MGRVDGFSGDTDMTAAASIVLSRHFEKLLAHDPGSRKGEDPEEVHKMRVASRRMRAALQLFRGYLPPVPARPVRRRLRLLAEILGQVRDLDVYRAGVTGFAVEVPVGRGDGLDELRMSCDRAWTHAHDRLVDHLERRGYARLQESCRRLIELTGQHEGGPPVAEAAPGLVWDRYQALLRRGNAVEGKDVATLHRVRIAGKRLRYSIESFVDVFGPGTGAILAELRLTQDHLGALNDALVASRMTGCFLLTGSVADDGRSTAQVLAPAVADYLAHTQWVANREVDGFRRMWERLSSPTIGGALAEAIGQD